jgi:hypothetical protein
VVLLWALGPMHSSVCGWMMRKTVSEEAVWVVAWDAGCMERLMSLRGCEEGRVRREEGRGVCGGVCTKTGTINEKHLSGLTVNTLPSSARHVSIISLYLTPQLATVT